MNDLKSNLDLTKNKLNLQENYCEKRLDNLSHKFENLNIKNNINMDDNWSSSQAINNIVSKNFDNSNLKNNNYNSNNRQYNE